MCSSTIVFETKPERGAIWKTNLCLELKSFSRQSNINTEPFPYNISVIDCGDPGPPYGGYRHIATNTKFNSVVTYTCKPDHHLEGEDSQVCQANGLWSGSKPVCLGKAVNYSP